MKESPFIAVLKRELDRMVSRRIYFASCIVLPLFSIFFMATIFGNGQMCSGKVFMDTSVFRLVLKQR